MHPVISNVRNGYEGLYPNNTILKNLFVIVVGLSPSYSVNAQALLSQDRVEILSRINDLDRDWEEKDYQLAA